MVLDLIQLKSGQRGVIVEIQGGPGLIRRLENMGIRAGRKISKIGAHFWHGPQIIKVGNSQVAVGYGMAKKIIIEAEK